MKTNPKKNPQQRRKIVNRLSEKPHPDCYIRQIVKPSRSKYMPHVGKKQLARTAE